MERKKEREGDSLLPKSKIKPYLSVFHLENIHT